MCVIRDLHECRLPRRGGWPWSIASGQRDHRLAVLAEHVLDDRVSADLYCLEAAVAHTPHVVLQVPDVVHPVVVLVRDKRSWHAPDLQA